MRTTAELKDQIDQATALLERVKSKADASPSAALSATSLEAHIAEMRSLLQTDIEERKRK
ncbi:MAG: hypothetical protein ACJ75H_02190 [Thermoanaerobaculia bacterium]